MLCQLCDLEEVYNFHHFIPRTLHKNKWFKKRYSFEELQRGIDVCKDCHKNIHLLVPDNKELGRKYNTLEKLKNNFKIKKYLDWKKKNES